MPIILIVDDSEVDQKLVAGLIKKDIEWIVEFADNGQTALDVMEMTSPNVVVTDLMMPEMDGIELVREAKKRYPQIPVVLMTGQGSETLAVKALKAGAASYVPKAALADSLMDTIEQVLQLADQSRSQERLCKCISSSRYQFNLPNEPELIQPLIVFISEMMSRHKFGDEAVRRHVGVAIEEAVINAMFHGNLELSDFQVQNARRDLHEGVKSEVVEDRRRESPYNERRILFGVDMTPKKAQFVIRDNGPGFNINELPGIDDTQSLSAQNGGRGLTLIGHFMDEFEFNDSGNELRMTLQCRN